MQAFIFYMGWVMNRQDDGQPSPNNLPLSNLRLRYRRKSAQRLSALNQPHNTNGYGCQPVYLK